MTFGGSNFTNYRAMQHSAKSGIALACRPSVCPCVCNVGGSGLRSTYAGNLGN